MSDLDLAHAARDRGDLDHAAEHAASAVMDDPAAGEVYELVDFLAAELGLDTAFPVHRHGNGEIFAGDLAARAHVMARAGEVDGALTLLLTLCEKAPGPAWLSGGALSEPAVRARLDPVRTAARLASLESPSAEVRAFAGRLADERPDDRDLAEWLAPMLGRPRDPAHPAAVARRHALAFAADGDAAHLVALVDAAGGNPVALDVLAGACAGRTWLNRVPMPTEAIVGLGNFAEQHRDKGETVGFGRGFSTAIEPASAMAAVAMIVPGVQMDPIAAYPEPDLRRPLRDGGVAIWRYQGPRAQAIHPLPSEAATELVRTVANAPWPSPVAAHTQAAPLGALPLDDLLALLSHVPPMPDNARWRRIRPAVTYWPRLAQPWICAGILHHQPTEPWAASTRRRVLVDLAFGIEDWTTDAALFALVVAAWVDPGARADVRDLVRSRLDAATSTRKRREMTIAESIADLMDIVPGATADDRKAAATLRRLANPREHGGWWAKWRHRG